MGVGLMSCARGRSADATPRSDGNPNPHRFEILSEQRIGACALLHVRYPDCTTYGGRKLLLFDNVAKLDALRAGGVLDPHFLESAYSPIARFAPTAEGRALAEATARLLAGAIARTEPTDAG